MNLTLDFGNTRVKSAVFDGNKCIHEYAYEKFSVKECETLLSMFQIKRAIVCSVTAIDSILSEYLKTKFNPCIFLDSQTPIPIINAYKTPNTLGPDRIALAVAAHELHPEHSVLVVDAGTALTYELIDETGKYLGGNIAPGANMRLKSLHDYTHKLPLVSLSDTNSNIGSNTNDAILNGVVYGIAFEIDSYISFLQSIYPNLLTFLTGGDAFFFAKKLKSSIFVSPNLLLIGLNCILNYNLCPVHE
ncbi:MAG TPA: type III pantothenate kinase [Candidatus Enterocola sp.]|jgi:type III pantothenate kinase|nr:type III pantothenate kinase [Candidatus Enterocola sp.]